MKQRWATDPLHIPLNARLALFLRFLSFDLPRAESHFIEHVLPELDANQGLRARKSFGALREGVDYFVSDLFRDFSWHKRADVSLDQIGQGLIPELKAIVELTSDDAENAYVSWLRDAIVAVDCDACMVAAGLDRVCVGNQEADSQLVARKGMCFRWLLDVSDYASDYSRHLYVPILDRFELAAPEACFNTGLRLSARPHGLDHHAQLAAKTEFRDTPVKTSVVTLFLTDRFDLPSWLATLYVLLHEYICHAYQAVDHNRIKCRDRPADSRFAEGWIDAVAHSLARSQIETPNVNFPIKLHQYRNQMLSEIQSLYDARYKPNAPESPSRRLMGVRAFERISTCFWFNSERSIANTRESIVFSLMLNVSARDDELDQIINLVLKLIPYSPDLSVYSSRSRAACHAMRSFIESNDVRSLVVQLTRLVDQLSAA